MNTLPSLRARFSPRHIIFMAGVTLWLGSMLVKTGGSGVIALATAVAFMAELIVLGSATRTVTIRQLVWLFLTGGAMLGVGYLGGMLAPAYPANAFVIPPMEETLKLAPVLWVLWRGRKARTWSMGVTDIMLMGLASGAGFAMVEDAYIRHAVGWPAQLAWLPITEISGGRLIVGHAIWTALAGMTIGWALLLRSRRTIAIAMGVSGYVWSILDHAANNYAVHVIGWSADLLNGITAYGWISIYLFGAGFVAAVAVDLYIIHKAYPPFAELELSALGSPRGRVQAYWRMMIDQRMLAFLIFQCRRASEIERAEIAEFAAPLNRSILQRQASPMPG